MVRLLWIAVVLEWLVILWQPFSPYSATIAVLAFFGTLAWLITLKLLSWDAQARERRRLLDDCNREHAAWKAGDDRMAFFGRWQPPPEMFLETAGPETRIII